MRRSLYEIDNAHKRVDDVESIVQLAVVEAERCGLAAMDALHVAAAYLGEAEVLYTLERPEKPMFRTSLVRVVAVAVHG